MSLLQALIFDVDGTLADTERDGHRVAFNQAFADTGLDWEWSVERYGELLAITGGKERIQFYLNQDHPKFEAPASLQGNLQQMIASLHAAKTEHYKQLLSAGIIPLRTGVRRLLLAARQQGIRLAIATTTTPANVIALLQTTLAPDAPDWFEVIAAGDIVPAKKPAPDIYHHTLQAMSLNPQNCLAIEDSQAGLRSAQQAGLKTVVTVNDYTQAQDFSGAVLVLNHLGEPDRPFQIISGNAGGATYFDLKLAEILLEK